jgi:hypothetical protein
MERHWHNDVCGKTVGLAPNQLGQSFRKPTAQWGHWVILEQGNGACQGSVESSVAAGEVEGVSALAADTAKRPRNLSDNRRNNWPPALLADRS